MSAENRNPKGHDWADDPRLLAYALGETEALEAGDVAEIEAALADDPACRAAYDALAGLLPRLESALAPEPAFAAAEVGAFDEDDFDDADAEEAGFADADDVALADAGPAAPAKIGRARLEAVPTGKGEEKTAPLERPAAAPAPAVRPAPRPELGAEARDAILRAAGESPRQSRPAWVAPLVAASLLGAVGAALLTSDALRRDGADAVQGEAVADAHLEAPSLSAPALSSPLQNSSAPAPERMARSLRSTGAPSKDGGRWAPALEAPHKGKMVYLLDGGEAGPGALRQRLAEAPGALVPADAAEAVELLGLAYAGPTAVTESVLSTPFIDASEDPFSTFSTDVDTASYTRTRATLAEGRLPSPSSVRIEEFVNYFTYDDAPPSADSGRPLALYGEVAAAPWNPRHRLVRIGVQAAALDLDRRESANLVFLVDVSGSMQNPSKLPLVKRALATLTESMRSDDRIAVVVYANAEGLALPSTTVAAREAILQALDRLEAGGSTNGGAGIHLAYDVARQHFVTGGINRVVLCTDGDFNVGVTDADDLEDLIAEKAADGVELTVLGFGTSERGDQRMETLSNRGNGNYAVIDGEDEALRVLANEVGGTLLTVARNVKLQVAFNPDRVAAFRLIGYQNRMLEHRDFEDDAVDAGEIGSGHHVTALYEVVPRELVLAEAEIDSAGALLDEEPIVADAAPETLRRAKVAGERSAPPVEEAADAALEGAPAGAAVAPAAYRGDGLLEVRVRYVLPAGEASEGFAVDVEDAGTRFAEASDDLRFAAAVATFGQILRGAPAVADVTLDEVRRWALEALGADPGGSREDFVQLVERVQEFWGR